MFEFEKIFIMRKLKLIALKIEVKAQFEDEPRNRMAETKK